MGKPFPIMLLDLFDRVGQAGFKLKKIEFSGEANFDGNRRVVYVYPSSLSGSEDERLLEHYRTLMRLLR